MYYIFIRLIGRLISPLYIKIGYRLSFQEMKANHPDKQKGKIWKAIWKLPCEVLSSWAYDYVGKRNITILGWNGIRLPAMCQD